MAEIQFNVNMDLVDKYVPAEDITIPQEDNLSVKFTYSIFNREAAEDLTGATDIVVSYVKPDGHIVLQSNGTLELPNKVSIVANAQAFTYVGKVYMQVQYKKGANTFNTRQAFFWVERSNTSCQTVASADFAPYLDNVVATGEMLNGLDLQALIDSKQTAEGAQADVNGIKPRVVALEVDVASLKTRMTTAEGTISTQGARIIALENSQGSFNTRMTNVENKNIQQDTRLSNLESEQAQQGSKLNAVESKNATQDTRLTNLESDASSLASTVANNKLTQDTVNTSVNNSLSGLSARVTATETKNTQQDTRLDTAESKNASQDTKIAYLEGANSVIISDIDSLESTTGAHEFRLDENDIKNTSQDSLIASNSSAISSLTTTVNNNQTGMNTRVTALETAKTANDTKNIQQDGRLTALENYDVSQDTRMATIENKNNTQDIAIQDLTSEISLKTRTLSDAIRMMKRNSRGFYSMHNVGDSISQGANSDYSDNNSWAGAIRKAIQTEYNSSNYGFVNFYGMGTTVDITTSWTTHNVTGWNFATSGSSNDNALGFISLKTSVVGANTQTSFREQNTKKFNKVMLEVAKNNTAGILEVRINGNLMSTIDCNTTSPTTGIITIDTSSVGFLNTIQVRNVSGSNELLNIWYVDDLDKVVFNNYANSGEKLTGLTDTRINGIFDCSVLFFSLGFNTVTDAEMDTIFAKCVTAYNTYKPLMFVNDFCWNTGRSNVSAKLKKFAKDTDSVYIQVINPVSNVSDLINSGFLSDIAHPTNAGHEVITNKILNVTNMSTRSKKFTERLGDIAIKDAEQDNRMTAIESKNTTQDTNIATLQTGKVNKSGDSMTGDLSFSSFGTIRITETGNAIRFDQPSDGTASARGSHFYESNSIVGGVGRFKNSISSYQYIGWGASPWSANTSLSVSDTAITYKSNPVGYFVSVPATATSAGNRGELAVDANYLYICYAANQWRRVALSAW